MGKRHGAESGSGGFAIWRNEANFDGKWLIFRVAVGFAQ